MLPTLFLFYFSAIAIYLACDYFVNAIEWCARHMKLGATAVGSVLAAFGTALPESAATELHWLSLRRICALLRLGNLKHDNTHRCR
ncbi:hypothetical protein ACFQNF_15165 [Iodobacter arcticus]|uniref:Sodium/calcium exchanger membrane region domain-containing protein n=1 Tax=Iodobacter arcticus TaxID=590593 RepID=A0ABW2QZV7_9NEIS